MPRTFFSVWSERLPQPRQSPIKNIIKVCAPSNELVNLRVEGMIRTITQVYMKCSFYRHRHAAQKLPHYIIFLCLQISFTSWCHFFFYLTRKEIIPWRNKNGTLFMEWVLSSQYNFTSFRPKCEKGYNGMTESYFVFLIATSRVRCFVSIDGKKMIMNTWKT